MIALDCISMSGPDHCGIALKYYSNKKIVTWYLHSLGLVHPQGKKHGCHVMAFNNRREGDYKFYRIMTVPSSTCRCILDARVALNDFMDNGGDNYQILPRNSPCSAPGCNSNYTTKCLLRKCGVDGIPPFSAPGWHHRMKRCLDYDVYVYPDESGATGEGTAVCHEWTTIDTAWCGPAAQPSGELR